MNQNYALAINNDQHCFNFSVKIDISIEFE